MSKNIIVTIGNEKLFLSGTGLSYGSGRDVLALMQEAVRVRPGSDWRNPSLEIEPDQTINIELTALELPPGEVQENADKTRASRAEASVANYSNLWLKSEEKVKAEKARADALQAKLDALNATLNPAQTGEGQE